MCLRSHLCLGSNLSNNAKVRNKKKEDRIKENKRVKTQNSLIRRLFFEFFQKNFREEIDKVTRIRLYRRFYYASEAQIKHFFLTEFYYDKDDELKIIL